MARSPPRLTYSLLLFDNREGLLYVYRRLLVAYLLTALISSRSNRRFGGSAERRGATCLSLGETLVT